MIRIYNGSDFVLDLSRLSNLLSICDTVNIKLFTTNTTIYAEYSKSDIVDNKIDVSYDHIQGIGEGVINCRYNIGIDNTAYPDLEQNIIGQFNTDYYLASGVIVPSEDDESLLSGVTWGLIVGSLDSQTDLSTRLNSKLNVSAFNTYSAATDELIDGKVDYTEFANEVEDLNDAIDLKADASGLTALETVVDNLPTSDFVSGINSKIDNHAANTIAHVTQADKDNWNSKQAGGNYASASSISQLETSIANVNSQFNNYYTKSQTDNAINNAVQTLGSEVDAIENAVNNNVLSKAEAAATYLTINDAESTYQHINNFITITQADERYLKKADPSMVAQTATTVEIQPNVLNVWGEISSLTITFAEGAANQYNEYMIQFESGSAATTLTLPASVQWVDDNNTVEANKTYQISIVNNLGIMEGW